MGASIAGFYRRTALGFLVASLLSFSQHLWAEMDYPYGVSFQMIRTPLMPLSEESPGADHWALRISSRWINVWAYQEDRFIIDGEEFQIEPNLRYEVWPRLQIGSSVNLKSQGGGVLDPAIERFHQAVGVNQGHREEFPRNRFNVSYEPLGPYYAQLDPDLFRLFARQSRIYPRSPMDPPLPPFMALIQGRLATEVIPVQSQDRAGASDGKVFVQYNLFPGVDMGLQYRFPIGHNDLFSSQGNALGVYLNGKTYLDTLAIYSGVSVTRHSSRRFYDFDLPEFTYAGRGGIENRFASTTVFMELAYFSIPVFGMGRLSKPGMHVSGGFYQDLDSMFGPARFTFGVAENFKNFGVTPDIGLVFSIEVRG